MSNQQNYPKITPTIEADKASATLGIKVMFLMKHAELAFH